MDEIHCGFTLWLSRVVVEVRTIHIGLQKIGTLGLYGAFQMIIHPILGNACFVGGAKSLCGKGHLVTLDMVARQQQTVVRKSLEVHVKSLGLATEWFQKR